jgi:hypothetical protein
MTASNWAVCPKCVNLANVKAEQQVTAIQESYGKVTQQEYTAMLAAVPAPMSGNIGETFREDYEIYGAEQGEITVDYHGECTRCGLSLGFGITKHLYG